MSPEAAWLALNGWVPARDKWGDPLLRRSEDAILIPAGPSEPASERAPMYDGDVPLNSFIVDAVDIDWEEVDQGFISAAMRLAQEMSV